MTFEVGAEASVATRVATITNVSDRERRAIGASMTATYGRMARPYAARTARTSPV
jgi:hypothetical protein